MKSRILGDIQLQRVIDCLLPVPVNDLFPDVPRDAWNPYLDWLTPNPIILSRWELILPIATIVIRTPRHNILIDTCFGNDKDLPRFPSASGKQDNRYLTELALHGLTPADIDFVMCTHLHSDHCGWNTKLEDGRWVPTFPNARYIFSRAEFEYWGGPGRTEARWAEYRDSVLPVYEAGMAELVADDFQLDDNVWFEPAPGHTPNHVVVNVKSKGESAVVIGDMLHCPVQCKHPEWINKADSDTVVATETRRRLLDKHCETDTLFIAPHFPLPSAGHVKRWGNGYKLEMEYGHYW